MSIWRVPGVTTAQRLTLTPLSREILQDTDTGVFYGGDGVTVGGIPLGAGAGNVESPVIAFNDLSPIPLTTLQANDKVIKATVILNQAFDGAGASVTVGTDAVQDLIVSNTDIDITDVGTYEVFPQYFATGSTELKVFIAPGTLATTGEVFISLELGG